MSSVSSKTKTAYSERKKEFANEWGLHESSSKNINGHAEDTLDKFLWEPCRYGNYSATLPIELFSLSKDEFKDIFNMDVYNSLSAEDKKELSQYLPNEEPKNLEATLERLFSGDNFHFGNPVDAFVSNLLDGEYNAEICKYKDALKNLENTAKVLSYRKYHNKLVKFVLEQKRKVGLDVDENMLDYYRLSGREENREEQREISKAKLKFERRIRKRKNEKLLSSYINPQSSEFKNLLNEAGVSLSRSQMASIPEYTDDLIYSDDEFSSSTASLLSEREEEMFDFDNLSSEEYDTSRKKKRKKSDSYEDSAFNSSAKRKKEKTRKEKRKSNPPQSFINIFTLFKTIKHTIDQAVNGATLETIVQAIQFNEKELVYIPPDYTLNEIVQFALKFLQKPPQFLEMTLLNNPVETEYSGIVRPYVEQITEDGLEKYVWTNYVTPLSDKFEELEKLFFFSLSRGQISEDRSEIAFNFGKHMKSQLTITASNPKEIEDYRRQERERYTITDQPFTYTWKGMKTTVAPLKKASAATRPHPLLKNDRPPYANLLALVRDAVARLPGGVGTRPDVAMLLKDSQFIVDDSKFESINSVVSGALDRLHSEEDPCVHYDSGFKLWVHIHRGRTEEDFKMRDVAIKSEVQNLDSEVSTPKESEDEAKEMETEVQ